MKKKRAATLLRPAALLLLAAAVALLVFLRESLDAQEKKAVDLHEQVVSVTEENDRLSETIGQADTDAGAAEIARSELDLASPDDLIFELAGK